MNQGQNNGPIVSALCFGLGIGGLIGASLATSKNDPSEKLVAEARAALNCARPVVTAAAFARGKEFAAELFPNLSQSLPIDFTELSAATFSHAREFFVAERRFEAAVNELGRSK